MPQDKVDLSDLKTLLKSSKDSRATIEPDWYLNLAYLMGNQWVFWNRGYIDKPKLEDWRVLFVDNRVRPIAVARAAKKTKNRPTFICVPATADDDAMQGTEIGEKILRYDWKDKNLDFKHLLAELWVEVCGSGFWKISWDKTLGQKNDFLFGPEGQALTHGENQAPVKAGSTEAEAFESVYKEKGVETNIQSRAEGDISVEVISPFELFPDPHAKSLDECEWMIEEKIRSKEYIARQYGEKFAAKAVEDAVIPTGVAESRYLNLTQSHTNSDSKGVKVYEYVCRDSVKYPGGKRVVWFNETIVRDELLSQSPYADFPYVMFTSEPLPGRFWPRSIMSDLRGPQTDLNKIQSQIRENAIRVGNPPVAIAREADVEWHGRIGEKVYYSSTVENAIPKPIEQAEVPAYVREEVERIENSIREISGIHEISNAKVPSGVTAASAINLLMEADDTRLGPEIQLMEKNLATAGEYILKLRAKFTKGQRIIRIAGEDGSWDIANYKREVLDKVLGVDVQAGSGMPQSKAARQAAMQEVLALALQYGVPLNPRSMRRFFEDYEMGGVERLFQDLENDEAQIVRENRKLYNGETVLTNIQDDHDLHIEGIEEEMKTAKYENSEDKIKGGFIAHLIMHKERRMQAVESQMEAFGQEQAQKEQEEQAAAMQLEELKQRESGESG